MLAIGSKAPDFKLKLLTGEMFHLRSAWSLNNIIISFFPDGHVTTEPEDIFPFLQNLQKAQALGTVVVAITHKHVDDLQKLLDKYQSKILIASDPTLEVCRNYRVFWLRGLGLRKITYVIDKKGIVRGCLHHHLFTEKSWRPIDRLLHELTSEQPVKP